MGLICTAPPLVEPVSLTELKEYCRIDPGDASQDTTIATLALDARSEAEAFTRKRFVQQTWQLLMDFFPGYIDLKLAGQKVSSPFVSGANAVLVGIRYAIMLPYPPLQKLVSFNYLNANGLTTSMIIGPLAIASVGNQSGQPLTVNTAVPHLLASNASVSIAGNAALVAVIGASSGIVITVTGDSQFTILGVNGTGSSIPAAGTITGFNFNADFLGQPARLAPVFGQMWPVARVILNAVQVEYVTGFATPILATTTANSATVSSSNYSFQASDIGRYFSVPGAGPSGGALNTIVMGLTGSPPDGGATLRDVAGTAVSNALSLLVNTSNVNPAHWGKIKRAICMLTLDAYLKRLSSVDLNDKVQKILYPVRDLRL